MGALGKSCSVWQMMSRAHSSRLVARPRFNAKVTSRISSAGAKKGPGQAGGACRREAVYSPMSTPSGRSSLSATNGQAMKPSSRLKSAKPCSPCCGQIARSLYGSKVMSVTGWISQAELGFMPAGPIAPAA